VDPVLRAALPGDRAGADGPRNDRDIVTPEHAVEMFRAIRNAQLCVVPNAGHGVMPHEMVLAFLQEDTGADQ
jgi:pimeloyl-ACP methyl ester carboxylesterase